MTINCTDAAPAAAVTSLPVGELERLVLTTDRPCTGDPDAWFPDEPDRNRTAARRRYEDRARALCRPCPAVLACLELTIAREGPSLGYGIAGGTAPWERQALKRTRARAER